MIFDFIHNVGTVVVVDIPTPVRPELNGQVGIVIETDLELDDDRPYHNIKVKLNNGGTLNLLDHHVRKYDIESD